MKTIPKSLFLFFGFTFFLLNGQNLVKNPSFESNIKCPDSFGSLSEDVKNWRKPSLGTTDYFNTCSDKLPVENNFIGSQLPFDGNAYVGLYLYAPKDYREYITAELETALEKDKLYKVSFMVNLADEVEFAIQEFGILFTQAAFEINTSKNIALDYMPSGGIINYKEIANANFYKDNTKWVEISTIIMGKGNERFLTIGNFKNNDQTLKQVVKKTARKSSYYFVDMVSVIEIPSYNLNELYVIEDLLFDFDETFIEISYNQQLTNLVHYLAQHPDLNVYLYGHTDSKGSKAYNDNLSDQRALTVANFLMKLGLSKDRISWKGYGFNKPVVDNQKDDLRFKNRRVEFLIAKPNSNYANTIYEDQN